MLAPGSSQANRMRTMSKSPDTNQNGPKDNLKEAYTILFWHRPQINTATRIISTKMEIESAPHQSASETDTRSNQKATSVPAQKNSSFPSSLSAVEVIGYGVHSVVN